ncbi:MAG: tRNA pseudouridine(13) synthase TruD, partial [Nitrosopumilales archaeon CG_4_9_14_0_2_um_filter_34_16]
MIPDLDSQIGITIYSTKFPGIGGKIRVEPEDFEVTELLSEKTHNAIKDQDGYAVYKLKKKKIDTNHALSGIFKTKGLRLKSLGLKDASAITEQ